MAILPLSVYLAMPVVSNHPFQLAPGNWQLPGRMRYAPTAHWQLATGNYPAYFASSWRSTYCSTPPWR